LESGLDEELRFHLDQQTEKNLRSGMAPEEARRQALIRFGGVPQTKERTRDELRSRILDNLSRDIRHGLRSLRRAPGFTVLASVTLALGIGASTAIFTVVNGVVLKPLPYPASENLVGSETTISATQFFTYRDENRTFAVLGLWVRGIAIVTKLAEPEQLAILRVTYGALQALGVSPAIGRWFSEQDDTSGFPESVILTHGYWQRRFGGDPLVTGRTLIVDSRPHTVIGVMPADFRFLNEKADLILPFQFQRSGLVLGAFNYFALARLKPGASLAQANEDVARMAPIWLRSWPSPSGFDERAFERYRTFPALRPLKESVVGDIDEVLWLLMGAIGGVLLIACANVANLLLVRAERKLPETAVRAALGAGWRRIALASLLENLLLALVGGAMALALAFAAIRLLLYLGPANLPRLTEITIDPAVLLFAFLVSVSSGLLVGLIPVVKHVWAHPAAGFGAGGRTLTVSRERHRGRNMLVIVQVALALVLLVASGLMTRTFIALRSVKPGFSDPNHVQLARITIPRTLVEDPEAVFSLQSEIRDRMAAIPGVTAAAFASAAPMEPFISANTVFAEDRTGAQQVLPSVRRFKFVSPGFFQTIGAGLIAGRDFTWTEVVQRRPVGIVSESMAREMWREPAVAVGKRIREAPGGPWREIVGVVEDTPDDGLHAPPPMTAYWPALMERFEGEEIRVRRSMTFAMRSSRAGTDGLLKDMQAAVGSSHRGLPVAQFQTLQALHERSLAPASFLMVMLAIAAAMALLLGLVGIYCVIAYAVAQRTREIGIRSALGARPGDLERMFIRQGLGLAAIGIVIGWVSAVGVTRFLSSLLFGIRPFDPVTYVIVSLGLIAIAGIASYVPAHRATAIHPTDALRAE
jgi:predicted permease